MRTNLKFAAMIVALIGVSLPCVNTAVAQQAAANTEFITSSSPLPDGSIVTTTYFPKSGAGRETKWAPGAGTAVSSPTVSTGRPALEQSVLQGGPPQSSPISAPTTFSPRPLVETVQVPNFGTAVMPANGNSTIIIPNWGNPFAGPRRYLPSNYQSTGYNVVGPQVATGYLPSGTVYPYPAASTVPTLNTSPQLSPIVYGANPRVNNQTVYELQNMRPGTYLGRGAIGQPKAYVDGQPLRNLLRYVFP